MPTTWKYSHHQNATKQSHTRSHYLRLISPEIWVPPSKLKYGCGSFSWLFLTSTASHWVVQLVLSKPRFCDQIDIKSESMKMDSCKTKTGMKSEYGSNDTLCTLPALVSKRISLHINRMGTTAFLIFPKLTSPLFFNWNLNHISIH